MRRHNLTVYSIRVATVALFVATWLLATGPLEVSPLLLPTPASLGKALLHVLGDGATWDAAMYTLVEIMSSIVIAAVSGVLVGFWIARGQVRSRAMSSLLAWLYMTPFVLFFPIFIMIFGIGPSSKIIFAATGGFIPIAYSSARAFGTVDSTYLRVARAFGASARQTDWLIKIRASLPMVRSGLRIGMAMCLIYVILGEMLGSANGLGFLLAKSSQMLAVPVAYALTCLILVLAGAFLLILNKVSK